MTYTSNFGVGRREGHDSRTFYRRRLYTGKHLIEPDTMLVIEDGDEMIVYEPWIDRIFCQSAEVLPFPQGAVHLAFTSPPYCVGKTYDLDMSLDEYLELIRRVGREVYRCLAPGGRYVINVANLGRKPYVPLTAYFYGIHQEIGFIPVGEVIWRKAKGAGGNCAWGSWMSASSPVLRDVHEYLLVFAKQSTRRPDRGLSDISKEEFLQATLSVWDIPPASARRIGHPAPFPLALAKRVIQLWSYVGDTVLDPFMGSGTTCLAARLLGRHYVGVDNNADYCALAKRRLEGKK